MFDNLMQNLFLNAQKQIEDKKKVLDDKIIEFKSTDENFFIKLTASGEIRDISISEKVLSDKEMLEDMLVVNINKALEKANQIKQQELDAFKNQIIPDITDIFDELKNDEE